MKLKRKIALEILLVIAAITVFIYNFSMQKKIAYIASIVAAGGTIAFLIKDIVNLKSEKVSRSFVKRIAHTNQKEQCRD